MEKRYELLKDLPDAKAGTILIFDGNDSYDYKSFRTANTISWYKKEYVENNPEWFREVTEQPKEDAFWNEELVKQFCNSYIESESTSLDGYMDMFKSSRTTTPIQPSTDTVDWEIEHKKLELLFKGALLTTNAMQERIDSHEKEMISKESAAFYAGRERDYGSEILTPSFKIHPDRYLTFSDYKNQHQ